MPSAHPTLADAVWLKLPALQHLFAALHDPERETRVIGGAVRNTLLGLPVTDMDLATELLPNEVIARATAKGLNVHPTGIEHGTVTVVCDGIAFEVTTLRRDIETDGRRAVVAFTRDWSADAHRRDFTINALSARGDGTIFDYAGGLDDLAARRVRFIGVAEERIREDYLRILRFFRFNSAYAEGAPDAEGLAACAAFKDGLMQLSAERIGAEMANFIVTQRAGEIAEIMTDAGVLSAASGLGAFPRRLSRLQEIEHALGERADRITRLAALFIGSREDAGQLAARFRMSTEDASALSEATVRYPGFRRDSTDRDLRGDIYRAGVTNSLRALRLAWAASDASTDDRKWIETCRKAALWQPPRMPFSGADVLKLGVPAGPRIGRILRAFEAWWIEADFPQERALLEGRLAALAAQS
jgi:poly(A) polymerase